MPIASQVATLVALSTAALAPAVSSPALGAGSLGAGSSGTRVVKIQDIAFKPSRITVRRGTTVAWRFLDGSTSHNVKSQGRRRFPSSGDRRTGIFKVRFRKAGTYRYLCALHPLTMKGKVVVR